MSNLDQSLDAILAAKPKHARKSRPAKASNTNGGVKKASAKTTTKPGAAAKAAAIPQNNLPISSKIIVHGLPPDITERQIKEYVSAQIGPVARCELAYNAQGVSKGSSTIVFKQVAGQNPGKRAVKVLNGVSIDPTGAKPRKLRVEIVTEAPVAGLAERLGLPKHIGQTGARATKKTGAATAPAAKKDVKSKKPQKAAPGRVKKVAKTADELDAEMTDYFAAK